jgi:hypothetical protein
VNYVIIIYFFLFCMKYKCSRPFWPILHVFMEVKSLKLLLSCNGFYCKLLIFTGFEDVLVLSDSDVVNIQNTGYDVAVVQSGNKNSSKWLTCYLLCTSNIFPEPGSFEVCEM